MQDTDATKTSIVWIVANNSFREDDRRFIMAPFDEEELRDRITELLKSAAP